MKGTIQTNNIPIYTTAIVRIWVLKLGLQVDGGNKMKKKMVTMAVEMNHSKKRFILSPFGEDKAGIKTARSGVNINESKGLY